MGRRFDKERGKKLEGRCYNRKKRELKENLFNKNKILVNVK